MNNEGEGAENMEQDRKVRRTKTPYVKNQSGLHVTEAFEPFDVVCIVGTVRPVADGGESATLAAFRLIAEHDAPGTYRFPNAYGNETVVEVMS